MFDWIFSFFHLFLLLGIVVYGIYSLFLGNISRFIIIFICLTGYYFLVLHKAIKKEIKRKKGKNKKKKSR